MADREQAATGGRDGSDATVDELPGAEALGAVPRRLLLSATRCFAASGFHGTTTRDIAAGAGLSPAALYVHFPSKELALFEIVRLGHEQAHQALRSAAEEGRGDASARLGTLVATYTRFHAEHHVVARVCQYELSALHPEHFDAVLRVRHDTNEVFRVAVAAGVDDGTFAADLDVRRVARAVMSLAIDLVRWYRPDGEDSPERLGELNAALAQRLVAR